MSSRHMRPTPRWAIGAAVVVLLILSEFTTPGAALTAVPAALPPRLVARFVAGLHVVETR